MNLVTDDGIIHQNAATQRIKKKKFPSIAQMGIGPSWVPSPYGSSHLSNVSVTWLRMTLAQLAT